MSNGINISDTYAEVQTQRATEILEAISSSPDLGFRSNQTFRNVALTQFAGQRYIDPQVARIIVAAIGFLGSLFDNDSDDQLAEIQAWLARISGQLHQINQLLADVLNAMRNLGVFIDARFDLDAEADILSRVATYADNVGGWKDDLASPTNIAEMSNLLLQTQTATRKVMIYGYAGAFSVFYGMRAERDLLFLLNKSDAVKTQCYQRYASYFASCSDPNIPGSLANLLPQVRAELEHLRRTFPARDGGDFSFIDPPRWYREDKVIFSFHWRKHFVRTISGDIERGYVGDAVDHGHVYADSSRPAPDYFPSYDAALADAKAQIARELLPLNTASDRFKLLTIKERSLTLGLEGATQFRNVAQSFLG